MKPSKLLGLRIIAFRKKYGLTLRDMQKATKIHNSTLCRIENGLNIRYDTGKFIEAWLLEYENTHAKQ